MNSKTDNHYQTAYALRVNWTALGEQDFRTIGLYSNLADVQERIECLTLEDDEWITIVQIKEVR